MPSNVIKRDISEEMKHSYLDYAMSVIVSRALPDVRDGLKPVQRRIIYAMQDQNMNAGGKFNKCAAVNGEVMKKYHPHGDSSIYEALVRMGQDFTLRYPLIWPQGNFGSIDGDPAAAPRYTECKLQHISEELYKDIDKDTVDYVLNDLQNYEPAYLPSLLPNLLLNGVSGIAVGMATNIPPHNSSEVIAGMVDMIENADRIGESPSDSDIGREISIFDGKMSSFYVKVAKPEFSSSSTIENLIKFIKGPDFPTGGTIYNQKEIMQMYATGRGKVITRAKMDVEEIKGGKTRLVVTEIPYQVNKATLVSKIADLHRRKKIEGIADLRDESNKKGMRIVIELKRDAIVKKVQNRLYKYTPLQSTFNGNFVALIDNEPKLMTLKTILEEFIKHRQQVVIRRTLFLLKRAKEREHILQGLKIALDNIDEVIKLIRSSKDVETAKAGLINKFGLTEIQAQAILDMQLRRLAALERQKIEDELKDIIETISGYEKLLASPIEILSDVKAEFLELKDKYGDERKTAVVKGKVGELTDEDLITDENCIITISKTGYIKRLKENTYRKQGRGGKGVKGTELKEEDVVEDIKTCSTHDWALFFTNTGKVYKLRVWEIPESGRNSKGTPLVNFLQIKQDEQIQDFLSIDPDTLDNGNGYVFLATERGKVKKTSLQDFSNIRSSGIIAIKLSENDNLVFSGFTSGGDEILITTTNGQSIRFSEDDVRPMGRTASGVTGINLKKENDKVVSVVIIDNTNEKNNLMTVSKNGYGKKTAISEYKVQRRGGSGVKTYKVNEKTGNIVSARVVNGNVVEDILIATESGKIIRLEAKQVPQLGRDTLGVRLIKLEDKDSVSSLALLFEDEEETNGNS
ncbi:DNA gyrase subunit A [Patescibacteria group bacterium]|nr:DNA gyrase subunit A [Patescibacteria group bacterium]